MKNLKSYKREKTDILNLINPDSLTPKENTKFFNSESKNVKNLSSSVEKNVNSAIRRNLFMSNRVN